MSSLIETTEYRGCSIEKHYDQDAESPREGMRWCLGRIVAWHRRYHLSDDKKNGDFAVQRGDWPTFREPNDFKEYVADEAIAARLLVLPVFMFDHGSVALSTGSFNDRWDSGQVGWIYTTHDAIKTAYDVTEVTPEIIEKAREALVGEIETYGAYVNGETYGFIAKDESGKEIDSRWGYIGDDGDDYMMSEARSCIDHHLEKLVAAAAENERAQDDGEYGGHA